MDFTNPLISFIYIVTLATNIIVIPLICKSWKRSRIVSAVFISFLLVLNFLCVYSTLIEPGSFEVNHHTIPLHTTPSPVKLKIALVADFHANSADDSIFLQRVVDKLNEIDVDYIVIGGDMIDYKEDEIPLLAPLLDIKDKNHTIIVLGNHDYGRGWSDIALANKLTLWLRSNGFTVLRNENMIHQKDGSRWCIVGVDSLWSRQIDLGKAYEGLDPNCSTILLSHNPDVIFLLGEQRADLMLSGHTHGGQVCLPFVGAPWIPSKIQEGCGRGLYTINDRKLFITKGTTGPIRFNAKPEIAILELT